eukprot:1823011-Pyramimonas_sp.AAC.1
MDAAIPESSAFMKQVSRVAEPELDHLKEGDRAGRSLKSTEIVTLRGSHVMTRMVQREVWVRPQRAAPLLVYWWSSGHQRTSTTLSGRR